MPKHKPVIAVTGPDRGAWPAWFCTKLMVWWVGGQALRIRPKQPCTHKKFDGLILGGGADIDPTRYKSEIIKTIKQGHRWNRWFLFSIFVWLFRKIFSLQFTSLKEDKLRDELEFALLAQAVEKRIPVLGICRGAQLINVHFGGSLHPEIADFYTEEPHLQTILPRAKVWVETDSRLHQILQRKIVWVNSLHHQSVRDVGENLRVAAREKSGVIEAIEHLGPQFLLGVQWHPEFLPLHRSQRQLFAEFVEEAARSSPHLRAPGRHINKNGSSQRLGNSLRM